MPWSERDRRRRQRKVLLRTGMLNSIFNHTSIEVTKAYIGLRDDEKDKLFAMLFSKDLCYS